MNIQTNFVQVSLFLRMLKKYRLSRFSLFLKLLKTDLNVLLIIGSLSRTTTTTKTKLKKLPSRLLNKFAMIYTLSVCAM